MPKVCIIRPNRSRPRLFTIKDAARIYCEARANSGLPPDTAKTLFIFEVNQRCGWGPDPDVDRAKEELLKRLTELITDLLDALPWARLGKKIGDILKRVPAPLRDRIQAAVQKALERLKDASDRAVKRVLDRIENVKESLRRLPPPE